MRELKGVVPNQTAISCSSEELAKQVHIILKECGYTWKSGDELFETLHYRYNVHYHIYDEGFKNVTHNSYVSSKTVITAEEFIKINENMEKLTKEQVYVKITSNEEAVKLRDLLQKAGEPIYEGSRILSGFGKNEYASFWDIGWQYGEKYKTKQVTLEQLAEILGVRQFKIGDRVKIKESSQYYHYNNERNPRNTIGAIFQFCDNGRIRVEWGVNNKNSYLPEDLELVTEAKPEQYISVTRENLGGIYNAVCGGWKAKIEELLETADKFAVNVDVPLTLLKKAYSEANTTQTELLKEIAPLPKEKVTVNVSRFINIYKDMQIVETHLSKEDALKASVKDANYVTTIELTGEYETEV